MPLNHDLWFNYCLGLLIFFCLHNVPRGRCHLRTSRPWLPYILSTPLHLCTTRPVQCSVAGVLRAIPNLFHFNIPSFCETQSPVRSLSEQPSFNFPDPPMVNPVARYPLPGGLVARVIHQSGQPDYSTGLRIRRNISYSIL